MEYKWLPEGVGYIYFLLRKGIIIYVGQSINPYARIAYHRQQAIDFNSVRMIPCQIDRMLYYEARWIKRFAPEFNTNHKPKPPRNRFKKTDTRNPKTFNKKRMKLRKLTEKSIMGFGRHLYTEVHAMPNYTLAEIYFTCSHINFFDIVLDRIGIKPEDRIEKPGRVEKEKFLEWATKNMPDALSSAERKKKNNSRKNSFNYLKISGEHNKHKAYHKQFNQR